MTLGLLSRLLLTRKLKFDEGVIDITGIHFTMLPAFFVGELMRYFFKEEKQHILYLLSWVWGYTLVYQIKHSFNLKIPDQVYSFGMDVGELLGLGIYKTHHYYPGRYTYFKIHNNPFIRYLKEMNFTGPVDYFISGCMGGGGCLVHEELCQNIELKCKLEGAPSCEFLTGTQKELESRGLWDIVCFRYKLDEILPCQKEFYRKYNGKNEDELIGEILEEFL